MGDAPCATLATEPPARPTISHKEKEMSINKLMELHKEVQHLQSAWYKSILTIASGGFALLAGLGPHVPPQGMGKYFLAGAWVCLGLGIVAGAATIYTEVDRATRIFESYRAELLRSLDEKGQPTVAVPVVSKPRMVFSLVAPRVMIASLLMAVVLLVVYSVLLAVG